MVAQKMPVASSVSVPTVGALRTAGNTVERYNGSAWVKLTAYQAVKMATAPFISLTGDAAGAAAFDGSKDVSINVAINADNHKHERPLAIFGGAGTQTANGNWGSLVMSNVWYDNSGINNGRFARLNPPGWWLVTGNLWCADNPTGQRIIELWGADGNIAFRAGGASDGAGRWARTAVALVWSDGGKQVEMVFWQNCGGNLAINEWTMCAMWFGP